MPPMTGARPARRATPVDDRGGELPLSGNLSRPPGRTGSGLRGCPERTETRPRDGFPERTERWIDWANLVGAAPSPNEPNARGMRSPNEPKDGVDAPDNLLVGAAVAREEAARPLLAGSDVFSLVSAHHSATRSSESSGPPRDPLGEIPRTNRKMDRIGRIARPHPCPERTEDRHDTALPNEPEAHKRRAVPRTNRKMGKIGASVQIARTPRTNRYCLATLPRTERRTHPSGCSIGPGRCGGAGSGCLNSPNEPKDRNIGKNEAASSCPYEPKTGDPTSPNEPNCGALRIPAPVRAVAE
jgi:hypothetical protein